MKKAGIFFIVLLVMTLGMGKVGQAAFPEKPIHIVVYTAPGGLIDITARLIANIAQKKYAKVPVIVENKKGAGGVVALSYILSQPADGYTVFGMTSSVISKTIRAKQEKKLNQLHYLARMVADYECLITNKKLKVVTFQDIIEDAKAKRGNQIWVGPAAGGTDHLFAMKVWDLTGIKAKWIPYRSGGQAVAALLGGHGVVYVGNPQDTIGRPDLFVAAVASPERLKNFPDSPTFRELGYDQLTGEVLWRGFAIKKGTDPKVIRFLEDLFRKVSKDPEWVKFCEKGNVIPVFDTGKDFAKIVEMQIAKDKKYLKYAGLLK